MLGTNYFESMPSANEDIGNIEMDYKELQSILSDTKVKSLAAEYGVSIVLGDDTFKFYLPCNESNRTEGIITIHKFVNELDNATKIYFRNHWMGNCGIFADKISYTDIGSNPIGTEIKENEYISVLKEWQKKGYGYVAKYDLHRITIQAKLTERINDIDLNDKWEELTDCVKSYLDADYTAEKVVGCSQASPIERSAIVIYYKKQGRTMGQMGYMVISQNKWGVCFMNIHAMGTQYDVILDLTNYQESIKDAVYYIMN